MTTTTLDNLKENVTTTTPEAKEAGPLDAKGRVYATGKRKNAIARVWLKAGTGKITINGKELSIYLGRPALRAMVESPFTSTESMGRFDVMATTTGGGLSGQAGGVRHGISKALALFNPTLRSTLKQNGFLTRDPRVVERKKSGQPGARKRFQFSKR